MLAEETPSKTHEVAVQILDRVARPVMQSFADEKLREPPSGLGKGIERVILILRHLVARFPELLCGWHLGLMRRELPKMLAQLP